MNTLIAPLIVVVVFLYVLSVFSVLCCVSSFSCVSPYSDTPKYLLFIYLFILCTSYTSTNNVQVSPFSPQSSLQCKFTLTSVSVCVCVYIVVTYFSVRIMIRQISKGENKIRRTNKYLLLKLNHSNHTRLAPNVCHFIHTHTHSIHPSQTLFIPRAYSYPTNPIRTTPELHYTPTAPQPTFLPLIHPLSPTPHPNQKPPATQGFGAS